MTTYKLEPAGHDAPDIVKRTYSKPDRRLQLKFEEWLENDSLEKLWYVDSFQAAERAVSKLEASVDEAHSLLIQYQYHPQIVNAGLFLSAVYNQQPDNTIVYDVETATPINYIGCSLAEHKTLTLNAQSGDCTGCQSSGTIITNAQSGEHTGWYSSGIIITNAQSEDNTGRGSSGIIITNALSRNSTGGNSSGIIITNAPSCNSTGLSSSGIVITNAPSGDYTGLWSSGIIITNASSRRNTGRGSSGILLARTTPEGIGENSAKILLPNEIKANKQLDEYLAQLCDETKALRTVDDIAAFKETYGEKPQEKIKQDIERLLQ